MNKKIIWVTALVTLIAYAGYTTAINISGNWTVDLTQPEINYLQNWLNENNMTKDELASMLLQEQLETLREKHDNKRYQLILEQWEIFRTSPANKTKEIALLNCITEVNNM